MRLIHRSFLIVLVSGFLLVGGAGVVGVAAAAKAMTFADDNLRKALCISLKQFRQSGSDPIRYFIAIQPATVVLEKYD